MQPLIILGIAWPNFTPVGATNANIMIKKKSWTLPSPFQWTIFGNHYRDRLMYVSPLPIIKHSNYLFNYERRRRHQRYSRNYHIRQQEKRWATKCLFLQSQFESWDKDNIIKGQKHTMLHLPHLMINKEFDWHTSKFDPPVIQFSTAGLFFIN